MTAVFISGSRSITKLPDPVCRALDRICDQNLIALVGDCKGVDALVQDYFRRRQYDLHVKVYHADETPRIHLSSRMTTHRAFEPGKSGRAHHTIKDIAMTTAADFGLVVWDGRSAGSKQNLARLADQNKPTRVWINGLGMCTSITP